MKAKKMGGLLDRLLARARGLQAIAPPPPALRELGCVTKASLLCIWHVLRQHLIIDFSCGVYISLFVILFAPTIPRATDNAQMLSVWIDDEVPLTMGLDAMTTAPYGNPANYYYTWDHKPGLPEYFKGFVYIWYGIYGGLQFDAAIWLYAPLKWLGAHPFPLAPIILRTVSFLGGLLSLILLYNFARRYVGYYSALFAVAVILTDSFFAYYTMVIHPDTLQLGLGMLALLMAIRHVENGDLPSLVGMGIVAGLVQGTKIGGPWLAPMVTLATFWGLRRILPAVHHQRGFEAAFLRRLAGLGAVGSAAFFVSTPYAALDSYYVRVWRLYAKMIAVSGTFGDENVSAWISKIIDHHGRLLAFSALAGLVVLVVRAMYGHASRALVLAAVLAISNILWYTLMGKLWVEVGYMLVAYALLAVILGELVASGGRWIRTTPVGNVGGTLALAAVFVAVVGSRAPSMGAAITTAYNWKHHVAFEVGHWTAEHLPRDSRIMHVHAYLDPKIFPQQKLLGLLRYADLLDYRPDYFIISAGVYDAEWYKGLRKTQRLLPADRSPVSVRLYQDLLDNVTKSFISGPTSVPGIELVKVFSASSAKTSRTYLETVGRYSWLAGIIGQHIFDQLTSLYLQVRIRMNLETDMLVGPTLILYHLKPDLLEGYVAGRPANLSYLHTTRAVTEAESPGHHRGSGSWERGEQQPAADRLDAQCSRGADESHYLGSHWSSFHEKQVTRLGSHPSSPVHDSPVARSRGMGLTHGGQPRLCSKLSTLEHLAVRFSSWRDIQTSSAFKHEEDRRDRVTTCSV